ncbi:MAG TPA: biopolymer transporter ExbD [Thermoanaerobaculia bacterium]|nr:biopolymer transporter ExbD [Thermoanaerobaculia bacterium]
MKLKHRWHSSVGKLGHQAAIADINVTPFVDVCLVLLIIFMVVTPMLGEGVPVNLPVTDSPVKTPDTQDQLRISVKTGDIVYVGDQVVRSDQVEAALKLIHERTPNREIVVKGDRLVSYGAVLNVLRACRETGFQDVGLIAQPAKGPGAGTEG